ncbi:Hypothetical protein NTJ_03040 [Nesidiocoris tenuis]|uniref:Uncharacterized protein n=1 Tax=Nesidiocoris tenuis TaxID=355587 RepID=A0ABN7AIR9_9HEMI|nr:Hypothetical protein NTJ_03040 [Nesidiocoris tenuis]
MPLRPASPRPDKEGSPRILYRREGGEERRGSPGWNPRTPRAIGGLPLGGPSITDTRTRDPLAPPVSTLRRKVSFMKMVTCAYATFVISAQWPVRYSNWGAYRMYRIHR